MIKRSHPGIYDEIGRGYAAHRVPDARIAAQIAAALEDSRTVCNVGAGAGSYEPTDRDVVAVEPSLRMIRQRPAGPPTLRAVAETLPFRDGAFDAALATLTIHHWLDPRRGLAELSRVARRRVVFTFEPGFQDVFWLIRDYVPAVVGLEEKRAPSVEDVVRALGGARVEVVPVPWDCTDGFQAAYWRRPERYLEPGVRASISTLAQLPPEVVDSGMARLAEDLASGAWAERNGALLASDAMDFGYRLVVAPP